MVRGDFECYGNDLISLEGAPEIIDGFFNAKKFTNEDYEAFAKKRREDARRNKQLNQQLSDTFSEEDLKTLEDF